MNFRKNSKGITLIALVVTIIVLLILAGVTLSLVAGSNGILGKASNAVDRNNEAQIAEEVELAMAGILNDYYEARYVEPKTTNGTYAEYAKAKLESEDGVETSKGKLTLSGTKVSYTKDGKEVATGTFNETTGTVKIAGGSDPTPEEPETPEETKTLSTLGISNTNIGDYIDLGNNIVGTEATTDDWRILYVDSKNSKVYAILADYLPNGSIPEGDNITKKGYSVWSTTNRTSLLDNYILNGSKWSSLANRISRATVTGGPTYDQLKTSWNNNSNMTSTLSETVSYQSGLSDSTGLYIPHTTTVTADSQNTYAYWLALPNADSVWAVLSDGSVGYRGCGDGGFGVRPVVCLPSDIPASKTENIWKAEQ